MPRKGGGEWDFVEKWRALPKGNWNVKCKFCPHSWDGGANRVRAHILGLTGYGVGKCEHAPQHVYKRPKAGKMALDKAWDMQARKEVDKAVRRFFFAEDIPFWKVRSPYFIQMLNAVGRVGQRYKPPSYQQLTAFYDLNRPIINIMVSCIEDDLLEIREKWKLFGCSILCDGWSDTRNRPIINIMVSCIFGTMFLKYVDTSCEVKSGEYIFEILKDAIMNVGPENVVQICMDNASNCVRAGYLVEQQWPHILYTQCTCHCLDLLFEDIGRLEWVKPILDNAVKVVVFVTMKPSVLALFRKHSTKDLVKPAQTRVANMFIMLSNLLDERVYNGLRSLMVSQEYTRKKVARTKNAEDVSFIILSAFFWRQARDIVKICAPILKVLRLADREGATMGLIYELTDRMIESISSIESIDSTRLEEVKNLCVERWNMLHSPLHAAAHMLHPIWKSKSPQLDSEVHSGWIDLIERYTSGDIKKQGVLIDEMDMYKSMEGLFARPIAKDENRMHNAVKWWETFGARVPNLQKLALHKLSQGSCASPCHLGFQKMEVTLEMIEKEEDDRRLLALQEEHDGQIPSSSSYSIVEGHAHQDIIDQEDIVVDDGDGDGYGGDDDDDDEEEEDDEDHSSQMHDASL
ncbi:hypothetical protein KP509_1Z277400 [Ceratopteris richardii]|nr:hypothetical protein KP509_1Z277400 [Ceratopteris richardii]